MKSDANETQIGGDHYQVDYQPWDFITDLRLPYLMGCVVKYIFRYPNKGGAQDLQKAIHYLNKCEERLDEFEGINIQEHAIKRFVNQEAFPKFYYENLNWESINVHEEIITLLLYYRFEEVRMLVNDLQLELYPEYTYIEG